jgi:hypothetical protein
MLLLSTKLLALSKKRCLECCGLAKRASDARIMRKSYANCARTSRGRSAQHRMLLLAASVCIINIIEIGLMPTCMYRLMAIKTKQVDIIWYICGSSRVKWI